MFKNKSKKRRLFILANLICYIGCVLVLVYQASLDGNESANQSNSVGQDVADIINGSKGDQTVVVNPTEIKLEVSNLDVYVGNTYQISYTVLPDNSTYKSCGFESSNTDVLSVNSTGLVTFKKAGTANVKIFVKDYSSVTNTINFTVSNVEVESISSMLIDSTKNEAKKINEVYQLSQYMTYTIKNEVLPVNATDKKVEYVFDAIYDSYFSIQEGKLYIKKDISNPIVIKVVSGTKEYSFSFIAEKYISEEDNIVALESITVGVTLLNISINQSINVISSKSFKLSFYPSNATNTNVTISSSDSKIVKVSGSTIKGLKYGEVTLKISSKENSNISVSVTVKVIEVDVTKFTVKLDNTTNFTIAEGVSKKLSISSVTPSNASYNYNKTRLSYESSNTEVLTVDSTGKVTGLKPGVAIVSCKIDNYDIEGNISGSIVKNIEIEVLEVSDIDDFSFDFKLNDNNDENIG